MVVEKFTVQAQLCQCAATAQAWPPCQAVEGLCCVVAESPFLSFPPLSAPAPLCLVTGAARRDTVLSPGSCESENFRFLAYIVCINGEHCKSPCSLHASPGCNDAWAEPGSLCSAPKFMGHNGHSLPPVMTSRSPLHGGCGCEPLAPKQDGGSPTVLRSLSLSHGRNAADPSSSLWPFARLFLEHPCLF